MLSKGKAMSDVMSYDMDFSEALIFLKNGYKIKPVKWPFSDYYCMDKAGNIQSLSGKSLPTNFAVIRWCTTMKPGWYVLENASRYGENVYYFFEKTSYGVQWSEYHNGEVKLIRASYGTDFSTCSTNNTYNHIQELLYTKGKACDKPF